MSLPTLGFKFGKLFMIFQDITSTQTHPRMLHVKLILFLKPITSFPTVRAQMNLIRCVTINSLNLKVNRKIILV